MRRPLLHVRLMAVHNTPCITGYAGWGYQGARRVFMKIRRSSATVIGFVRSYAVTLAWGCLCHPIKLQLVGNDSTGSSLTLWPVRDYQVPLGYHLLCLPSSSSLVVTSLVYPCPCLNESFAGVHFIPTEWWIALSLVAWTSCCGLSQNELFG